MLTKARSTNALGKVLSFNLERINKQAARAAQEIEEQNSEEDSNGDDFFDEVEEGAKNLNADLDPSKLIDIELIKLLRYCKELEQHKETEDYQEDLMLKSLELGKKTKAKLLIFDMDETLVAAKFDDRIPKNFQASFSFDYQGSEIQVRLRPFLVHALEKLSEMFEMIVFTAGMQEYADAILDKIDPENKYFSRRLYRQDCI